MKPGRNDPCPCGSGKKHKKCCGFEGAPLIEKPSTTSFSPLEGAQRELDGLLARYAPLVSVQEVENFIRNSFSAPDVDLQNLNPQAAVLNLIESVFNDDNLTLKNRKHAERLFKALVNLWQVVREEILTRAQSS